MCLVSSMLGLSLNPSPEERDLKKQIQQINSINRDAVLPFLQRSVQGEKGFGG